MEKDVIKDLLIEDCLDKVEERVREEIRFLSRYGITITFNR